MAGSLQAQDFGNALTFTSGPDYVEAPAANLLNEVDQFTIELWAKFDAVGGFGVIVGKMLSGNPRIDLQFNQDARLLAVLDGTIATSSTFIVTDEWYHLAYVYDGTQPIPQNRIRLFINGLEESLTFNPQEVPAITEASSAPLRIGTYFNNGFHSAGTYDELRIWSIPRTQAEIQSAMNTTLSGNESGLEAYYKFDEMGSTTTLPDLTSNGYNGTLVGLQVHPGLRLVPAYRVQSVMVQGLTFLAMK
ncbi:MAG: LamG domain-containing protein [Bacteroidota bacterium]